MLWEVSMTLAHEWTERTKIQWLVTMLLTLCTRVPAYEFAGGTGEPNDPYQIGTAGQLISIGSDPNLMDKNFVLVGDIDLDAKLAEERVFDRAVIAAEEEFTGSLDGRGHAIRNLDIHAPETTSVGLFGKIGAGGTVCNVRIVQARIMGAEYTGALAGIVDSDAMIRSCHSESRIFGECYVGGLVGENAGSVVACSSTGTVIGDTFVGGLIGYNYGDVESCYSDADAVALACVGGLAGNNGHVVSCCYATGIVVGVESVGGLVGRLESGSISSCYSVGVVRGGDTDCGGLIGSICCDAVVWLSYWDTQSSRLSESAGGRGKTTSQMFAPATFLGWGEGGQWTLNEGLDYPRLAWQAEAGIPLVDQPPTYGGGTGEQNDPYQIWTAEQLVRIGFYQLDLGKHFILMTDLDLVDVDANEIIPIGSKDQPFEGEFNGADHVIANLKYPFSSTSYVGLFGYVGSSGSVRNLDLRNVEIRGTSYVGGLVGCNKGTIERCFVSGSVTGSLQYIGGLVGYNSCTWVFAPEGVPDEPPVLVSHWFGGDVSGCVAEGEVRGGDFVGGLIGYSEGANILSSSSFADVEGSAIRDLFSPWPNSGIGGIGGLVGVTAGGQIYSCHCGGKVGASGVEEGWGALDGYIRGAVGGLVGKNGGFTFSCYSMAEVIGIGSYVGGLVGNLLDATVNADGHFVSYNGGIQSCYAAGKVTGNSAQYTETPLSIFDPPGETHVVESEVGGLVGHISPQFMLPVLGGDVDSCFWDVETSGVAEGVGSGMADAGVAGKTTAEMQQAQTFLDAGWDFAEEWTIRESEDYPRHRWEDVEP